MQRYSLQMPTFYIHLQVGVGSGALATGMGVPAQPGVARVPILVLTLDSASLIVAIVFAFQKIALLWRLGIIRHGWACL